MTRHLCRTLRFLAPPYMAAVLLIVVVVMVLTPDHTAVELEFVPTSTPVTPGTAGPAVVYQP